MHAASSSDSRSISSCPVVDAPMTKSRMEGGAGAAGAGVAVAGAGVAAGGGCVAAGAGSVSEPPPHATLIAATAVIAIDRTTVNTRSAR